MIRFASIKASPGPSEGGEKKLPAAETAVFWPPPGPSGGGEKGRHTVFIYTYYSLSFKFFRVTVIIE
jgi:hypothetical protein